jgi:hypothetical protein
LPASAACATGVCASPDVEASLEKEKEARLLEAPPRVRRILSVDDDPINQMVVQTMLAPEGYEVRRTARRS